MAKNTSDSIEEYIKQLLAQSGIAEIKAVKLGRYLSKLFY